jgi:riboflavin kinase/FMN adenylyltransferase
MDGTYDRLSPVCIAFGRFDGVHVGHRRVMEEVVRQAGIHGAKSVSVCLDHGDGRLLTTPAEQDFLIRRIDENISVLHRPWPTDGSVEKSVAELLPENPEGSVVVAGAGNRFLPDLGRLSASLGFSLVVCDTVSRDGTPVCSANIERELVSGSLPKANEMLGHPYLLMGEIVHGKHLGSTVGMPTANLGIPPRKRLPREGVYATVSHVRGQTVIGATHIGRRPAVDSFGYFTIETSLLDFSDDIYGEPVVIEVRDFLRGVEKFANLGEVRQQVEKDLQKVRRLLG